MSLLDATLELILSSLNLTAAVFLCILALSFSGQALVRALSALFGNRLFRILFQYPSSIIHELLHAGTALAFGHRILRLSPTSVTTVYDRSNLWQRLGVSTVAIAPALVPLILFSLYIDSVDLISDVLSPVQRFAVALGIVITSGSFLLIAGLVYAHTLMALAMRLSETDLYNFCKGLTVWLAPLSLGILIAFTFFQLRYETLISLAATSTILAVFSEFLLGLVLIHVLALKWMAVRALSLARNNDK